MDIYSTANQMKLERKTIFDMPMRVTFYARVSTTREVRKLSERVKWGHNSRSNTFPKCMLHNQAVMQHFSFYYNS